jgi:hypothetical protein
VDARLLEAVAGDEGEELALVGDGVDHGFGRGALG